MLITNIMDIFDTLEDNFGIMLLQGIVMVLAVVIIIMIYSDKSTSKELQEKIDTFQCPTCPPAPECPDCNCSGEGGNCPDCVCDNTTPLDCPKCPKCPETSSPTLDQIVNAIFPGRNQGMTTHGNYFSVDDLSEKQLKSTFQPMDDLTASTMGGGVPSRVSFEKSFVSNDVSLASKVSPPIGSGAGVFTASNVAAPGDNPAPPSNTAVTPTLATTDTATTDTATTDTATTDTAITDSPPSSPPSSPTPSP